MHQNLKKANANNKNNISLPLHSDNSTYAKTLMQ